MLFFQRRDLAYGYAGVLFGVLRFFVAPWVAYNRQQGIDRPYMDPELHVDQEGALILPHVHHPPAEGHRAPPRVQRAREHNWIDLGNIIGRRLRNHRVPPH